MFVPPAATRFTCRWKNPTISSCAPLNSSSISKSSIRNGSTQSGESSQTHGSNHSSDPSSLSPNVLLNVNPKEFAINQTDDDQVFLRRAFHHTLRLTEPRSDEVTPSRKPPRLFPRTLSTFLPCLF